MATLTGPEIEFQRELGHIVIEPWDPKRLNPNSYNLRLAPKLICYDLERCPEHYYCLGSMTPPVGVLDMAKENPFFELEIPPEGLVLHPGRLYLASTMEYTETVRHVPVIEGRSSVGRLGICVHVTAGFGDVGFKGDWTLEITVVHDVRVYAGVEICQIAYTEISGISKPYKGKYLGQRGPKPSALYKDFIAGVDYPREQGARVETGQPPAASPAPAGAAT